MPIKQPVIRIADPAHALFVSDIHLDDHDPALCQRVLSDLQTRLNQANGSPHVLFLLGDLFEYWVGDDVVMDCARQLADMLQAFAEAGGRSFLMHGNRDFLLDAPVPGGTEVQPYSRRCAATMLPDPCVIEVAGQRILLSHGDLFCTDDKPYQQWRAQCRQPAWQQQMLSRAPQERIAMAQQLRQQSLQLQMTAGMLFDVNQASLDAAMSQLDCPMMIHGHTHRPARHAWTFYGESRQRWVLSDWASGSIERGRVMSLAEGLALPAQPIETSAS